eukprot:2461615-Amphidinium_carterae.1
MADASDPTLQVLFVAVAATHHNTNKCRAASKQRGPKNWKSFSSRPMEKQHHFGCPKKSARPPCETANLSTGEDRSSLAIHELVGTRDSNLRELILVYCNSTFF